MVIKSYKKEFQISPFIVKLRELFRLFKFTDQRNSLWIDLIIFDFICKYLFVNKFLSSISNLLSLA